MARDSQRTYVLTLLSRKLILVHSDMLDRMKSKKCTEIEPSLSG